MIITKYHISATWVLALIMGAVLASCSKDNDMDVPEEENHVIAFASALAEQEIMTRATLLGRDFVVYGYKNVGGNQQLVFNGYDVKYGAGTANTSADNTHGYYYVEGDQLIKFWDFAAKEYHFWGATINHSDPSNPSDPRFSSDGTTLTIPNVQLQVGDEPLPPVDDVLFSELNDRNPVSDEVVQMRFLRPYAKLRIQFYTNDRIVSDVDLTNITFSPDPDATDPLVNRVYAQGDVVVTYPSTNSSCDGTARETVQVTNLVDPRSSLLFDMVTLTPTLGISSNTAVTAPIDESEGLQLDDMAGVSLKVHRHKAATRAGEQPGKKYYYYPLPMGDKNPAFIMSVCVNGEPELRTAVVPAPYMQWRANYFYTYIFKITDAGRKIELYDVKIDPWHYGGNQDEEWKNW